VLQCPPVWVWSTLHTKGGKGKLKHISLGIMRLSLVGKMLNRERKRIFERTQNKAEGGGKGILKYIYFSIPCKMYMINVKDAKELKTPHGKLIRWLLSEEIGAPNFEMRYFEINKESEPSEERHPWEHEVFVVKGEGIVKSGGVEKKVKPGDAIFILPNEQHMFLNAKEEPLSFICIIPKGCENHVKEKKD